MSATDLAARMGVEPSTVVRLELSERQRRVQLSTLDRAAQALDCEVVYALVPRRPLVDVVDERARQLAREELSRLDHTMLLEDQRVDDGQWRERLETVAGQIRDQPGLWRPASTDQR